MPPLSPKQIFVDSDAFVALFKTDDSNHKRAVRSLENLKEDSVRFLTSNLVFIEATTVISQRVSHRAAVRFISILTDNISPFIILHITEEIEEQAFAIFQEQTSKNVSVIDCANIALILDRKLNGIFSFDRIYRQHQIPMVEDW